jgi:hypothetical protein
VDLYNQQQMALRRKRRAQGKPLRDFESGVFTVAMSDGGYRLCTDYRELNKFAGKQRFQMEGVKDVATMIQRDDFAMLVDLKDCHLTMGLHPSPSASTVASAAPKQTCVASGRLFPLERPKHKSFMRRFSDHSSAF